MNLTLRYIVAISMLVTASFGIAVSSAEEATPPLTTGTTTAEQIITQTADVYRIAKSYSDSGVATTVLIDKSGKSVDKKPFTTAFVRPDRFRFEYSEKFSIPVEFSEWISIPQAKPMHYIVWSKGEDVRTKWDIKPGIEKEFSLSMALAAATGVSGGTAHTIPVLLMPKEIGGWCVTQLHQLNRITDAPFEGVECYRIQGRRKASDSELTTLWISKETFLIHRIDSSHTFRKFRTETTTTYKPKVNAAIDESALTFDAPKESGK